MGVDIYGLKPNTIGTRPELPDNYQDLSQEEKQEYWDSFHHWEEENPGYYFGNNWWHWRPIQMLIHAMNNAHSIGIPEEELKHLGSNDGIGVSDAGHCEQLAMHFKDLISNMEKANTKKVFLNLGHWYYTTVSENGNTHSELLKDEVIIEKLNDKYGSVFFQDAELDGVGYETSHATNIDNLKEFALFLDNCNGFKIH